MEPVSRRMFFKQAGAAAAVVAVAGSTVVAPLGLGTALAGAATTKDTPLRPDETGEISLFVGKREVTIHDRTIAARLVRATR